MIQLVERVADFEKVIVQAGHNQYSSSKMEIFSFVSNEQINSGFIWKAFSTVPYT